MTILHLLIAWCAFALLCAIGFGVLLWKAPWGYEDEERGFIYGKPEDETE